MFLHKGQPLQNKTSLFWKNAGQADVACRQKVTLFGCKEQGGIFMRIQPAKTDLESALE